MLFDPNIFKLENARRTPTYYAVYIFPQHRFADAFDDAIQSALAIVVIREEIDGVTLRGAR